MSGIIVDTENLCVNVMELGALHNCYVESFTLSKTPDKPYGLLVIDVYLSEARKSRYRIMEDWAMLRCSVIPQQMIDMRIRNAVKMLGATGNVGSSL